MEDVRTFHVGRIGLYMVFTTFLGMLLIGMVGFYGTWKVTPNCKPWVLLLYLVITSMLATTEFSGLILTLVNKEWYNGVLSLIVLLSQLYFGYNVYRYRRLVLIAQHAMNFSGQYTVEKLDKVYSAIPRIIGLSAPRLNFINL
ncbi:hypothetical protein K493DRAFT_308308 [Basidiobolus meristosporus CBS 931.73]|uniref:Uncharacterized protein n=1 Tax=Basidiobolus meristosporus CBS 931.73 TaxID=1314790 RepID=A0A1Y1X3Z8_9FUNG|nr:hypothetical protein K493DRAFT_308308 [Basidiobolus meristosporus CBS 931.73]|eukprot:ORX80537.1 hypothetical protein K493DRAFT_308308 [Basidiobolus meristosporus CBS 931.73]